MITPIRMKAGNRMLRPFVVGQHGGRWFGRSDFWWVGVRFSGLSLLLYLLLWALLGDLLRYVLFVR